MASVKVLVEIAEVAEQLEELIERVERQDEIFICRDGKPIATLVAIDEGSGSFDDFLRLAGEDRRNVPFGTTSNHDDLYDDHGLPK